VLVALAFAALSLPQFRAILLDKRMALAIAIAAFIILPNALWALGHRDFALRSANKFHIQESSHWVSAIGSGLKGLLVCSVTFFAPLGIMYGIIFWKRPANHEPAQKNPCATLLLRLLLVSYALIVLAIIVFRISDVHDRWLQPILISSPLLAVAWLQPRLNAARLKWLVGIAGIVMVLVTIALHGRILWAERLHRTQPWNRPYDALAQQLKPALAPATTVLTDTTLLAGNLRLNIRDKIFTTPELAGLFAPTNNPRIALVWDAGGDPAARKSTRNQTRDWPPPDNLAQFAERTGLTLSPAQAQYFSAVFKYHHARQMKLGAIMVGRDSVEP
jgi:hypothetical protein